jgi:hypothetical protein
MPAALKRARFRGNDFARIELFTQRVSFPHIFACVYQRTPLMHAKMAGIQCLYNFKVILKISIGNFGIITTIECV